MATGNIKEELGSNLDQLSKSLLSNSEIKTTLEDLTSTVDERFDIFDEKIDDILELNDAGTTTFSPIKTVVGDNILGPVESPVDDTPNVIVIQNKEESDEEVPEELIEIDDVSPVIDIPAPIVNIESPDQSDTINELTETINNLETTNSEFTEVINNNTTINEPQIVPLDLNEGNNVVNNQFEENNTNDTFNEIINQSPVVNNTNNAQEIINQEAPSAALPQDAPVINFTENQFNEDTSTNLFNELTSPATSSQVIFDSDLNNRIIEDSPSMSDINMDDATVEEKTQLVELLKNEETNIQEISTIKNNIMSRQSPAVDFNTNNVKDDINTSLIGNDMQKVPMDTKIEVNATFGEETNAMFGKMLRQLVKLNTKFDNAFGE